MDIETFNKMQKVIYNTIPKKPFLIRNLGGIIMLSIAVISLLLLFIIAPPTGNMIPINLTSAYTNIGAFNQTYIKNLSSNSIAMALEITNIQNILYRMMLAFIVICIGIAAFLIGIFIDKKITKENEQLYNCTMVDGLKKEGYTDTQIKEYILEWKNRYLKLEVEDVLELDKLRAKYKKK
jgi:hypothetical protein